MKALQGVMLAGGLLTALAAQESNAPALKFTWFEPTDPAATEIARSGERLIDRVGGNLMVETDRMIATKGLEASVSELHLKTLAPPRPVEGKPRVTAIKCTSLRVRNPRNAPDAADLAALERVRLDLNSGTQPPKVLVQKVEPADAPAEWRVYRPISVAPNCLLCHGPADRLQPGVRYALDRYFPEDRAVDYNAYDWRGLIRVSYAVAANK